MTEERGLPPRWTKEQAFGILIRESKTKEQAEYNVARAQLEVLGFSVEEIHRDYFPEYSESELEEFSREFDKASKEVLREYEKRSQ